MVKLFYQIVLIAILIFLSAFGKFSAMRAECPDVINTSCQKPFTRTGPIIVEYPLGSGCTVELYCCQRINCSNQTELYIDFESSTSGPYCPLPDSKEFLSYLIDHNMFGLTGIPPCNDSGYGYSYEVIFSSASCSVWYPSKISCTGGNIYPHTYKPYICNPGGTCYYVIEYCWVGDGPDFILNVIYHNIVQPPIESDTYCTSKGVSFLDLDDFLGDSECLNGIRQSIHKEIDSICKNAPSEDLCKKDMKKYSPQYLDIFFNLLKDKVQSGECPDFCPGIDIESIGQKLNVIKEQIRAEYPNGWLNCRTNCD